ncbi:MAG: HupE/UreJ family protein [Polyangiaceae bacterium]
MKRALAALVLALGALFARPVFAHDPGLSKGEYAIDPDVVTLRLMMSQRDLPAPVAVPRDAPPPPADALQRELMTKIVVTRGGQTCAPTVEKVQRDQEDGVLVVTRFDGCGTGPDVAIDLEPLFKVLPIGATHAAFIDDADGHREDALHAGRARITGRASIDLGALTAPPANREPANDAPSPFVAGLLFAPLDRFVFLLALALAALRPQSSEASRSTRAALVLAAAFTLGVAIAFTIAARGLFVPEPRALGPLLAASVAYVGFDGLLARDGRRSVLAPVVASFGLVFGFATAHAVATPSLAFVVGVALGSLAVPPAITRAFDAVVARRATRSPLQIRRVILLLDASVVAIGLSSFLRRVLFRS